MQETRSACSSRVVDVVARLAGVADDGGGAVHCAAGAEGDVERALGALLELVVEVEARVALQALGLGGVAASAVGGVAGDELDFPAGNGEGEQK